MVRDREHDRDLGGAQGASREPVNGRTTPAQRIKRIWNRTPDALLTALVVIVILAIAEIAAKREWVSPLILAAPTEVWNALVAGFRDGAYWGDIASTGSATVLGFGAAVLVAITVSAVLVSLPRLERVVMPIIAALQTLPKIAIAPLIVLWLGFGSTGKLTIAAAGCFFPILVNTLQGLQARDRDQVELMRSLGASRYQLFRYVRLPNSVPYMMAGFHIGILFALVGAVVAEFVGSRPGLGYQLLIEKENFNVPGVFAILVILMVFGVVLHGLLRMAERRLAFWAEDVSRVAV